MKNLQRLKAAFIQVSNASISLSAAIGFTSLCLCQLIVSENCRALDRNRSWKALPLYSSPLLLTLGGGPRVVVSTAAFHVRVRGSVPGLGGLKETKLFLPHPRVKVSIVGSLREVACSASDRQGSIFESCVWRTVSSQSSHHLQEVLLAQFSLYVHKGGLKPDSFHFFFASHLGISKSSALLMFHSSTGCDTASAFTRRGEKTAWETLECFPDVTEVFLHLSKQYKQTYSQRLT